MKKQFVAAALLLLNFSCKKNLVNTSVNGQKSAAITIDALTANNANPYDSIGIRHNIVLDSVWNYVQRTKDTTASGKRNYIISYFKHYLPQQAAQAERVLINGSQTALPGLAPILEGKNITRQTKSLLDNLITDINQMQSMNDYPMLLQNIRKLEATAMEGSIPKDEQAIVLQASAVARYSSVFWHDKIQHNPLPAPDGFLKSILHYIVAVQADTLGAIYGIFSGSVEAEADYQSSLWTWYFDAFA